jgi:hypothetical protein
MDHQAIAVWIKLPLGEVYRQLGGNTLLFWENLHATLLNCCIYPAQESLV